MVSCLYNAAETLGKSREAMINDLLSGKSKYSNVFKLSGRNLGGCYGDRLPDRCRRYREPGG